MERLTDASTHEARNDVTIREVLARLAAYEDTGLEPEAVDNLRLSLLGAVAAEIAEEQGDVEVNRAKEIAHAEAEGRLVILPCPLGTTVYILTAVVSRGYPDPIIETVIREETFSYQHIGMSPRYLFFSYAEAEAALKKRKE